MEVYKSSNIKRYNIRLKLFNNINKNNSNDNEYKSIFIKSNDNLLLNLYNKNNQENNKNFYNNSKRNKKRKFFNNELLKKNIDKNKIYKFNCFSLDKSNNLYNKFKIIPNIEIYHNLTNEKLIKLTDINIDNSFIIHKQKKRNKTNFKDYINEISIINYNKSNLKNKLEFNNFKNKKLNKTFNNIRKNTLNSSYLDINYKVHNHKSWCHLFKKKKKFKSGKVINNKYKITFPNSIHSEKGININKCKTIENKKSNKSLLNTDTLNNNISPKLNNATPHIRRGLKKSSMIDRLLFKIKNKDECFEDYVSDGRPIDKYLKFRKQIEKNKKKVEKLLLELRRLANSNAI